MSDMVNTCNVINHKSIAACTSFTVQFVETCIVLIYPSLSFQLDMSTFEYYVGSDIITVTGIALTTIYILITDKEMGKDSHVKL